MSFGSKVKTMFFCPKMPGNFVRSPNSFWSTFVSSMMFSFWYFPEKSSVSSLKVDQISYLPPGRNPLISPNVDGPGIWLNGFASFHCASIDDAFLNKTTFDLLSITLHNFWRVRNIVVTNNYPDLVKNQFSLSASLSDVLSDGKYWMFTHPAIDWNWVCLQKLPKIARDFKVVRESRRR